MQREKGIITGHFITHWGVPSDIRSRPLRGIGEFAILEFAPSRSRVSWRYATNGMSSLRQRQDDGSAIVRTELYASTKERVAWVDDLLAGLAAYPYDYDTWLADGDTIDVGQPLDRDSSPYRGVLLSGPRVADCKTLGLIGGLSDNVLVHQVIGLLPDEVEYASSHGAGVVYQRLGGSGYDLLDVERDSVLNACEKGTQLDS